jgi:hypothetical protein
MAYRLVHEGSCNMPTNEIDNRQARLAAALRENLKRRKEQGRARRSAGAESAEASLPRGAQEPMTRPRPETKD